MSDCVFPHSYFKEFLPILEKEIPDILVCYEINSNISLKNMIKLKQAGIIHLQPGIEGFSASLLKKMNKDVAPRHNIAFLRYAVSLGLHISWDLLYNFPGDREEEYEETLKILEIINHFPPPEFHSLSIDRFSTYINSPSSFGINSLAPLPGYYSYLPDNSEINKIAYHFTGTYKNFGTFQNTLIKNIHGYVKKWQTSWQNQPPKLHLTRISDERYMLLDTRKKGSNKKIQFLNKASAYTILNNRRLHTNTMDDEIIKWSIENKLGIYMNGWYVSLITAPQQLLLDAKKLKQDE